MGEFANGEVIFQTKDGLEFYIAVLIDNKTFDFINETLANGEKFKNKNINSQNVLLLIADKVNNKELTTDFPICPICKYKQRSFNDIRRSDKIELGFATWSDFENLSQEDKLKRLQEITSL